MKMKATLYVLLREDDCELALVSGIIDLWGMGVKTESYTRTTKTGQTELVVTLPPPSIVIANKTKVEELLIISNKMFGTPLNLKDNVKHKDVEGKWRYMGDYISIYLLQKGNDCYEDDEC